jgi:hypothetical protein
VIVGLAVIAVFGFLALVGGLGPERPGALTASSPRDRPAQGMPPCDQAASKAALEAAMAGGVIGGLGMVNGKPTISIDSRLWSPLDLATRAGMIAELQCAIAGPGKVLAVAQIVSTGGKVLAEWDGVYKTFDGGLACPLRQECDAVRIGPCGDDDVALPLGWRLADDEDVPCDNLVGRKGAGRAVCGQVAPSGSKGGGHRLEAASDSGGCRREGGDPGFAHAARGCHVIEGGEAVVEMPQDACDLGRGQLALTIHHLGHLVGGQPDGNSKRRLRAVAGAEPPPDPVRVDYLHGLILLRVSQLPAIRENRNFPA